MRTAIATIAIGKPYQTRFQDFALPTWRRYAERHGYEIVCFDRPLDDSPRAAARSPAWQKLLILGRPELAHFDTVVWLDTDIVINFHIAPCIASATPAGMLGICEETRMPDGPLLSLMQASADELEANNRRRLGVAPDLYAANELPNPPTQILNGGVMVLGRLEHRAFLERVYDTYEDKGLGALYENGALSYEIARGAVAYTLLDPKFNALWVKLRAAFGSIDQKPSPVIDGRIALLAAMLAKVYFLHFAGQLSAMVDLRFIRMEKLPIVLKEERIRQALRKTLACSGDG